MRIYVAGPFSAPTREGRLGNTQAAIDIGMALFRKGHSPYIPHLTFMMDEHLLAQDEEVTWEEWMDFHAPWLLSAEALFFHRSSTGADAELLAAGRHQLQIFTRLDHVPDAMNPDATRRIWQPKRPPMVHDLRTSLDPHPEWSRRVHHE